MSDIKLTWKQRDVLEGLKNATGRPTIRRLADSLETARYRSAKYSTDEVRGQLRALERKGLAERAAGGGAVKWQTTEAGRKALELTEA